jgi:hypothetical protein
MAQELIRQLTSVIRIVRDYPRGLSILLGNVPPPTSEEICEMLDTARPPSEPTLDAAGNPLRVDGGSDFIEADFMLDSADMFNRVIERAGGWEKINEATRGWKKFYPMRWAILVDYVMWIKNPVGNLDGPMLKKVADKHLVSRDTVKRAAQMFPQTLATAILNAPSDEFDLGYIEAVEMV